VAFRDRAPADTTTRGLALTSRRATPGVLRVAVADDSVLVRAALEHLLAGVPTIRLVAVCRDGGTLLKAVDEEQPDVVVTDIRMAPSYRDEGIQIAQRLRESDPQIGVVVLSQDDAAEYALALFHGGSERRAYLLKQRIRDRAELVDAIEAVAHGGSLIDPWVADQLIVLRRHAPSPLDELTGREREVLALIARAYTNQAIATEMLLTKRSVEKHVHMIFSKLQLADATDTSRRVNATLIYQANTVE
jgi:DNA-binding NarL/FixJ family response regulator